MLSAEKTPKKKRNNDNSQEKDGRKWKTQITIKDLASYFKMFSTWSNRQMTETIETKWLKVKLIDIFNSKNFLFFLIVFLVAFLVWRVFSFFFYFLL